MPRYLARVVGIVPPPVNGEPSKEYPVPIASRLIDFVCDDELGENDEVDITIRVIDARKLPA